MKDVLIIRSAGFQQLDMNMKIIEETFNDYNIHMLTHEHGVKLAKKYKTLQNIYVYPYKEGFSFRNKVKELVNTRFDAVIIPVTNISAVGFFNVLFFSLSIKTRKRYICNLVSDIWEISTFEIFSIGIKNVLASSISFLLMIVLSIFTLFFLPLQLRAIRKKTNFN
ncbi:hypothetical protein LSG31_03835 [Fodinisporobacter ferrooxydans]|uniref:Uncharacterized protein n=1 Tax=Fodinisporobacter ferrooxydans TaxID=2901836 RepID=A0ABY4CM72_9BACL|nr:hypothetical protein LSG31_03835 [Alicyclobacillaceae bacterium MYW30-H2]